MSDTRQYIDLAEAELGRSEMATEDSIVDRFIQRAQVYATLAVARAMEKS